MKSAFVTWTNNALQSSDEFRQCLQLLKRSIPDTVDVHILETDGDVVPLVSDIACISGPNSYDALFVAACHDFITPQNSFIAMLNILKAHDEIDCLLPVAFSDVPEKKPSDFPYYTLRGFELYAQLLERTMPLLAVPRNFRPSFFLIRSDALGRLSPQKPVADIPLALAGLNIKSTYHAFFHSFSEYYSGQRRDIVRFLPGGIRSVLDVGCAGGYFGKNIREKTGCRVVGIEINPHESLCAAKYLDRVITGDFLDVDIGETFDCISCLDVIEHIRYPERFLEKVEKSLNYGGYLLCSIPNIGHWSVVEDLLAGRFDYVPAGILSVSHLRFFTEKTARSLIEDAGFDILFVECQKTPIPDRIAKGLTLLNQYNIETDLENLSCLGYYILAQKKCKS